MPNVPSKILTKVIEYATFHTEQDKKEGDKKEEDTSFDSEFVKVDQATLFELILVRLANPITLTSSSPPPPSSRPRNPDLTLTRFFSSLRLPTTSTSSLCSTSPA